MEKVKDKESLWSKVIRGKYVKITRGYAKTLQTYISFWIWLVEWNVHLL